MPFYRITSEENEAIVQVVEPGGARVCRYWYRDGDIVELETAVGQQLVDDGEAVIDTSGDPVSIAYQVRCFANPAAGKSNPFQLPLDGPGYLKNDGNGTLYWEILQTGGGPSSVTNNGDGTFTHDDGLGVTETWYGHAETITSLSYNVAARELTYTDELGVPVTHSMGLDVFVDGGTFNPVTEILTLTDNSGATPDITIDLATLRGKVTDNLDGTYTYSNNKDTDVTWSGDDEVVTAAAPLTGAAPDGAQWGFDNANEVAYYVDAAGNWEVFAVDREVVVGAIPLTGVAPEGAKWGYDSNLNVAYYVDPAGDWEEISLGAEHMRTERAEVDHGTSDFTPDLDEAVYHKVGTVNTGTPIVIAAPVNGEAGDMIEMQLTGRRFQFAPNYVYPDGKPVTELSVSDGRPTNTVKFIHSNTSGNVWTLAETSFANEYNLPEVVISDVDLVGAAPEGAKWGYNRVQGVGFTVDASGNWEEQAEREVFIGSNTDWTLPAPHGAKWGYDIATRRMYESNGSGAPWSLAQTYNYRGEWIAGDVSTWDDLYHHEGDMWVNVGGDVTTTGTDPAAPFFRKMGVAHGHEYLERVASFDVEPVDNRPSTIYSFDGASGNTATILRDQALHRDGTEASRATIVNKGSNLLSITAGAGVTLTGATSVAPGVMVEIVYDQAGTEAHIASYSASGLAFDSKFVSGGTVSAEYGKHVTVIASSQTADEGGAITLDGTNTNTGDYGVIHNGTDYTLDVVVTNKTVEGNPTTRLASGDTLRFTNNSTNKVELDGLYPHETLEVFLDTNGGNLPIEVPPYRDVMFIINVRDSNTTIQAPVGHDLNGRITFFLSNQTQQDRVITFAGEYFAGDSGKEFGQCYLPSINGLNVEFTKLDFNFWMSQRDRVHEFKAQGAGVMRGWNEHDSIIDRQNGVELKMNVGTQYRGRSGLIPVGHYGMSDVAVNDIDTDLTPNILSGRGFLMLISDGGTHNVNAPVNFPQLLNGMPITVSIENLSGPADDAEVVFDPVYQDINGNPLGTITLAGTASGRSVRTFNFIPQTDNGAVTMVLDNSLGGGGSIYDTNGTLSSGRNVQMNEHHLQFLRQIGSGDNFALPSNSGMVVTGNYCHQVSGIIMDDARGNGAHTVTNHRGVNILTFANDTANISDRCTFTMGTGLGDDDYLGSSWTLLARNETPLDRLLEFGAGKFVKQDGSDVGTIVMDPDSMMALEFKMTRTNTANDNVYVWMNEPVVLPTPWGALGVEHDTGVDYFDGKRIYSMVVSHNLTNHGSFVDEVIPLPGHGVGYISSLVSYGGEVYNGADRYVISGHNDLTDGVHIRDGNLLFGYDGNWSGYTLLFNIQYTKN